MAPRATKGQLTSDKVNNLVREECRKWMMIHAPDIYESFFNAAYDALGAKRNRVGRPLGSKNKTTN